MCGARFTGGGTPLEPRLYLQRGTNSSSSLSVSNDLALPLRQITSPFKGLLFRCQLLRYHFARRYCEQANSFANPVFVRCPAGFTPAAATIAVLGKPLSGPGSIPPYNNSWYRVLFLHGHQ